MSSKQFNGIVAVLAGNFMMAACFAVLFSTGMAFANLLCLIAWVSVWVSYALLGDTSSQLWLLVRFGLQWLCLICSTLALITTIAVLFRSPI